MQHTAYLHAGALVKVLVAAGPVVTVVVIIIVVEVV